MVSNPAAGARNLLGNHTPDLRRWGVVPRKSHLASQKLGGDRGRGGVLIPMQVQVCVNYFSVADKKKNKTPQPRQLIVGRASLGLESLPDKSLSWWGGIAARGRHDGRSRKLRAHVFKP